MFFGLQVDRGNFVQAVSDNLLDDLGISTNGTCFILAFYLLPEDQLLTDGRIQHGQHYLSDLLPLRRIAFSARLEENRPGPLDSHADLVMVYSSHVAGSAVRESVILGYSCLARYLGGIQIFYPGCDPLWLT